MKKILMIAVCALVGSPAGSAAQESLTAEEAAWFDLIRADIREGKADFVGQAMNLSVDEAAAFWPIYQEYEAELKLIWDSHLELIEDYAANYEGMSDEKASELGEWALDLEVQRIQLLKETFRTMSDDMSSVTAARFIQIENRIDMLVNMEIMTELPMLEPPGM